MNTSQMLNVRAMIRRAMVLKVLGLNFSFSMDHTSSLYPDLMTVLMQAEALPSFSRSRLM